MTKTRSERLEAIEREIQRQNEAWQHTREALGRLGNIQLAVPREVLSQINPEPAAPLAGLRA
jgi:hypothetical protein